MALCSMRMTRSLPRESFCLDAFDYLFCAMTPNWVHLKNQFHPRKEMDNEQRRQFEKTAREEFDRAQRVANKRLRKWLTEGAIAAFVRDPEHDQTLQLPRDGWDGLSELKMASQLILLARMIPKIAVPTGGRGQAAAAFFDSQ